VYEDGENTEAGGVLCVCMCVCVCVRVYVCVYGGHTEAAQSCCLGHFVQTLNKKNKNNEKHKQLLKAYGGCRQQLLKVVVLVTLSKP
jgi:hypothetical protein